LAHKPADYIKGDESNAEKKARYAKEHTSNNSERRNYNPPSNRDRAPYRRQERQPYAPYNTKPRSDDFTPLNTRPERILKKVYESKVISEAPTTCFQTMGTDKSKWCKYHRV